MAANKKSKVWFEFQPANHNLMPIKFSDVASGAKYVNSQLPNRSMRTRTSHQRHMR